MRIKSLQISGFKDYDQTTVINFLDEHGNFIFDSEGDERSFILEAILGIIFGFTPEEKKKFRGDSSANQTFTGLVTLVLDQKTLLIERDFETDVIACLLTDISSSRPIFQGKDIVGNGFSRPYLDMLRSIFPIVDKTIYLDILNKEIEDGKSLNEILHSLYLLFSPSFNLNKVRNFINRGENYLNHLDTTRLDSKNLEQLTQFKECLLFLKSIQHFRKELNQDLDRLNQLLQKIKQKDLQKDSLLKQLDESFKELKDQNPILLRAEILLWKGLEELKSQNEKELEEVRKQINEVEQTLRVDLAEFDQLPPTIDKDIKSYQDNRKKMVRLEKKIQQLDMEIKLNEVKYRTWKTVKFFFVGFITPISFILSYIAFQSWFLIVPEAFFFFLIFLFMFGHYHSKIRERLINLQEDRDILKKRLTDTHKAQEALKKKWYFLKDERYFQAHEERLSKFKELKSKLNQLKRHETRIKESLTQPSVTQQLETFRKKYSHLIDPNRPDLEEYLDRFVALKSQLSNLESNRVETPVIQELQKIIKDYRKAVKQLKSIHDQLSEKMHLHQYNLPLDQILEAVSRRIKNLQLGTGISFEY